MEKKGLVAIGMSEGQMLWLQSIFEKGYYKEIVRRGETDYSFHEKILTQGTGFGFEVVKPKCGVNIISLKPNEEIPPSKWWRLAILGDVCLRNILACGSSNYEWEMEKLLLKLEKTLVILAIFIASSDLYPWELSAAKWLASDAAQRRMSGCEMGVKFLFQGGGAKEALVKIIEGADTIFGRVY